MRAVIYARYSSDLQSDSSIEDQVRLCREMVEGRNWREIQVYSDRAASGSNRFRPAYQEMITDARRGAFDVVVAEALDRLSRDQEDVAALFKVRIPTQSGRGFRFDAGRRSEMKPATIPN
ncbi:MAG: recombinase family protein [Alphaproteobacteria bacterium]|nr:recombinase family protein [Alphaproteobacteria bacterium]MBM3654481.1 recombinase family protein [Alphaproteobacteria bacterium]